MASIKCSSESIQFEKPPSVLVNPKNELHVWKIQAIQNDISLLNEDEKEIASRFRRDGDKFRFITGRSAVRLLASKYLQIDPLEIHFSNIKGKKPFITEPVSQLKFNLSHSGGWVLIAFANHELGIDIEYILDDFSIDEIVQDHFTKKEQSFISGSSNPVVAFFNLWTRKEALTKAWGMGIGENLRNLPSLDGMHDLTTGMASWHVVSINLTEEYKAAIAFPSEISNIRYFEGADLFPYQSK